MQKVMEITLIAALIGMAIAALVVGGPVQTQPAQPVDPGKLSYGLAMVFVLLTYGGWNEAAYIAGEVRDARRNMTRILVWGIVAVTALYMLVNVGYLVALGMTGMAQSKAVAADVMRMVAGDKGAIVLALIVCVSAFTTMNAAIFTGARTNFALGQDYRLFGFLGNWRERGSTPANALILQGVVSLLLVYVGSTTPDGFNAMVAYTSPVFWTFFLLTGITLFVFRARGGEAPAFKVPLFPLTPLIFIGTCAYMLWSSIDYIRNPIFGPKFGDMVLGGIVIMAVGIPMYWLARRK
jgi:amino acid transporter